MDNLPPPPLPPAGFAPQLPPPTRNWWQRNWPWVVPTGCVSLLVLLALFVGGIVFVVFGAMKSSDVYKLAVQRAERHQQVIDALGTPIKEGLFLSGNINVSGASGQANLAIPLRGPKAKGTLYAVASKREGSWEYSTLRVRVEGTEETIDLLQPVP